MCFMRISFFFGAAVEGHELPEDEKDYEALVFLGCGVFSEIWLLLRMETKRMH